MPSASLTNPLRRPKEGEAEVPQPIDIKPRVPDAYVLRAVVWNVCDVIADDVNFAGEEMSDIYVKGFLRGMESKKQSTDVHYRSLNGEGNFNWRMVWDFDYLMTEDMMVVKNKASMFQWNKEETKVKPLLALQIWDNDLFSSNDYLGLSPS